MPRHSSPNRSSTPSKASDSKNFSTRPAPPYEGQGQTYPQGATISPEDLAEFQRIYCKDYGVSLTPEDAQIRGQQLVELFRLLLRPPR